MSQVGKFKNKSFCVGSRIYFCTINIHGAISTNGTKFLKGTYDKCKRSISMTVSDDIIEAAGLRDFFKNVGKFAVSFGMKNSNNFIRATEIASNNGTSKATKNPARALLSTLGLNKFAITYKVVQRGRFSYLGKKRKH